MRQQMIGVALIAFSGLSFATSDDRSAVEAISVHLEIGSAGSSLVGLSALPQAPVSRSADETDWLIRAIDTDGEVLSERRVTNPWHQAPLPPPGEPVAIDFTTPAPTGTVLLELSDSDGLSRWRQVVDEGFLERAHRGGLELATMIEANRRRLLQRRAPVSAVDQPGARGFDALSSDRQAMLIDSLAWAQENRMRTASQPVPGAEARGHSKTQRGEFSLTGQLIDGDTEAPIGGVRLDGFHYDEDWNYLGWQAVEVDAEGHFSVPVAPGHVYLRLQDAVIDEQLYYRPWHLIAIEGDTSTEYQVFHGVTVDLQVSSLDGDPIADYVAYVGRSGELTFSYGGDAQGRAALVAPQSRAVNISISPPAPWVPPAPMQGLVFDQDQILDIRLNSGHLLRGLVLRADEQPIFQAWVVLRLLSPTTTSSYEASTFTAEDGSFSIVVDSSLRPANYIVSASNPGYLRSTRALEITSDLELDFHLHEGIAVAGTVTYTENGTTIRDVTIRAQQSGQLVSTAVSDSAGQYLMSLEPGRYDFSARPLRDRAVGVLGSWTAQDVEITDEITLDVELSLAPSSLSVELRAPTSEPSLMSGNILLEVWRNGEVITAELSYSNEWDSVCQCRVHRNTLPVTPGSALLRAHVVGLDVVEVPLDLHTGANQISLDLPAPMIWKGVLRAADLEALPQVAIRSFNRHIYSSRWIETAADGSFEIAMTPGGTIWAYSPDESLNIGLVERIDPSVAESRSEDIVYDEFPAITDHSSELVQIWGEPDRERRFNVVILGDGYTDVHETFTDTNGNGTWDGVLYYDFNFNEVYDADERYAVYGDADPPVAGSDPTLDNEPFDDLNGDGVLSVDDQALFERNVIDTVRGFFSQDLWRDHRDEFNIFIIRVISNQTGHDIFDDNDEILIERDTALDTSLVNPSRGFILSAGDIAFDLVASKVPEVGTRIVLFNQPIPMGRATSAISLYGGPFSRNHNGSVVAHELGHNLGHLADEYTEFQQSYTGPERMWTNVTTGVDRETIPWSAAIGPDREMPSRAESLGVGLYTGGYYRTGGVYRPTDACAMRTGVRFCPVCTDAIEQRMAAISGLLDELTPLAPSGTIDQRQPDFTWQGADNAGFVDIEVEDLEAESSIGSWRVYDQHFTLEEELEPSGSFRWRARPGSETRTGDWSDWMDFSVRARELDSVLSIPGVARASGAGGSFFKTALWLFNPHDKPLSLRLRFVPAAPATRELEAGLIEIELAARSSVAWGEVLGELFGINSQSVGVIVIESPSGDSPLATARTYNDAGEAGTFGQYIIAESIADIDDETKVIHGLDGRDVSRTNVGIVNLSAWEMDATLELIAADGTRLSGPRSLTIPAWSMTQSDRVDRLIDDQRPADRRDDPFSVRIDSDRPFQVYASMLDQVTSDPIFLTPQIAAADQWIDGIASIAGNAGAYFRSRLVITNDSDTDQTLHIDWRRRGQSSSPSSVSLSLPSGETASWEDVLAEAFGLEDAGLLRIRNDSGGIFSSWARTYDDGSGPGTLGQYIPAFSSSHLIPISGAYLLGISQTPLNRSNLGLINVSSESVEVEIIALEGGIELARKPFDVAPTSSIFEARILQSLGIQGRSDLTLWIRPSTGGAVYGWVSIVDNRSTDQTFIRPLLP